MTRPTLIELRERVHGAPPPQNTTEPCRTCADADGAMEYGDGRVRVLCVIPRERARLYPLVRSLLVLENAVMPCWRKRT